MRLFLAVVILLLPQIAFCNQQDPLLSGNAYKLNYYLQAFTTADGSDVSTNDLIRFVKTLEKKRASMSSQKDFVNFLFEKTHRRFLRSYSSDVPFSRLLRGGTYNCLTGIALYALLLDHFNVEYKVIETNHHIFMLAETGSGRVLFEATDPENGFVQDAGEIQDRIDGYRKTAPEKSDASKTYFEYTAEVFREVNLDEIQGLMHYNLSVSAYNRQDLTTAVDHLIRATRLYQSSRILEYSRIVFLTIRESNLPPDLKREYLEKASKAAGTRLQAAVPATQVEAILRY
jgi:hypothetical protein